MYRATTPNAYRESAVMTASPAQLVVMLYDGAGRFLRQALAAYAEQDATRALQPLARAMAIVEELLATLDIERGGEIATRLQGIYVWSLSEMSDVRFGADPKRLEAIAKHLLELRDGWAQVVATAG